MKYLMTVVTILTISSATAFACAKGGRCEDKAKCEAFGKDFKFNASNKSCLQEIASNGIGQSQATDCGSINDNKHSDQSGTQGAAGNKPAGGVQR